MLKTPSAFQHRLEMVSLEEPASSIHLPGLMERRIRFDSLRERTAHFYCPGNGQPALDPVVFFKMLFIGYMSGIRTERRWIREIEVSVAYRWFYVCV